MTNVKINTQKRNTTSLKNTEECLKEIIRRFPSARIMVIGDCILDEFVWGTVERISPEAPVPVVNVIRESFVPGGSLNVANNIRTLGGTVYPCGVIGRDLRGRMLVKAMRREGVETAGMIYDVSRPTTLKTRVIAHSQQLVRFDREDNRQISAQELKQVIKFIDRTLPKTDVIIIEDYGKGMIVPELLTAVIKRARALGKPVLVDPKEKHFSYYRGVTVITPNRKEALCAYGAVENAVYDDCPMGGTGKSAPEISGIGKTLLKKFACEAVLITMGEEGMMLFEKNGSVTKIPTVAQEVYDVSGAGDTVIAVLAMALAGRASMKEAAVLSNFAAGVVVGKLGTATLTREELKKSFSKPFGSQKGRTFTHASV